MSEQDKLREKAIKTYFNKESKFIISRIREEWEESLLKETPCFSKTLFGINIGIKDPSLNKLLDQIKSSGIDYKAAFTYEGAYGTTLQLWHEEPGRFQKFMYKPFNG